MKHFSLRGSLAIYRLPFLVQLFTGAWLRRPDTVLSSSLWCRRVACLALTAVSLAFTGQLSAQSILSWELSAAAGTEVTINSSVSSAGIGTGVLSRGAGVAATGGGGSINSTGWFNTAGAATTISQAIANNEYYQFTVPVSATATISAVRLVLRSSGTGPNTAELRSSADNYASTLGNATAIPNNAAVSYTITFPTALTGLTGTVTFRLYGYGGASNGGSPGTAGSFRIGTSPTASDNDIEVIGSVSGIAALSTAPANLTLTGFPGTASAAQTYTLSASSLTATVGITAPAGVEVSTASAGPYGSTLSLPASTTSAVIYARLASTATGTVSGTITNGSGSLTANVGVSGVVSTMRITEYMYAPISGNGEFVELTNVGNAPVDLTGWSFDDNTRTPGSFAINGSFIVQPGESVIITEVVAAVFRNNWNLPASVKIAGNNNQNLGNADEINIYNAANALVDRLTYNSSGNVITNGISAWTTPANLGANTIATWQLSVANDVQRSYSATSGDLGNPGMYYPISSTLTGSTTVCTGSPASLSVAITNGTAPYTVVYAANGTSNTVNGYVSGQAISVSPTTSTTYTVVSLTDANNVSTTLLSGMLQSGTAIVTVNQAPTVANAGASQTITTGSSATLAANTPTTGTGSWSVTSGPSTAATQFTNTADPVTTFMPAGDAGNYVLTWTISNAPCTPSSSSVTISVVTPVVNLSVSASSATENPAQTVTVFAIASSPVVGDQTVVLTATGSATRGSDYFIGAGDTEIKILNGQTQGSTSFNVINDTDVEGTETATLTISSVTAGLAPGTVLTQNIDIISDDVTPAALAVNPTSLTFTTTQGTASAQQTYVVSATALTAGVTITASAGVEISQTSGSGFATSVTLPASTTSATIYARLSAGAAIANPFSGTIANVSGSLTATVAISGTVNAAPPVCGNLTVPGDYATIQAAIDAACPGVTITVAAGTYTEQLTITKSLTIVGAGAGSTIVKAPATLAVGGPDEGAPYIKRNIVEIKGTSTVAMSGLTIDGPITGQDACGTDALGIYVYDNSNLALTNAAVTNIRLSDPSLFGCQVGYAIGVGLTGTPGSATLTNVTVSGYQKGGLLVRGAGSMLVAQNLVVTGIGATTAIGQNGIQISDGASATITSSTIANNNYTPPAGDNTTASGIITFNSGPVTISGSLFTGNDVGLDASGTGTTTVTSNTFSNNEYASIYVTAPATVNSTGNTFDKQVTNNNKPGTVYAGIQVAVDDATAGDVLTAAAGTFVEDVTIPKSLTLLGSNAGIDPNTGARVPETIIVPATANGNVITLPGGVANVRIDGFTVNGNNPALTGTSINGTDADAATGISSLNAVVSGVKIANNIIQNFTAFGIVLDQGQVNDNASATAGHEVTHNKIDNIGPGSGTGVLLAHNVYAVVTDNVITRVRNGVQTGNHFKAAPAGSTPSIANNTISGQRTGIFHNLQYQSATPFTIAANTLTVDATAASLGIIPRAGLLLTSLGVPATISSNTVGAGFIAGAETWNNLGEVVLSGGMLQGNTAGVSLLNRTGFGDASTKLTVSGVTITNSPVGVLVLDDPAVAAGLSLSLTVTGNTQLSGTGAFTAVAISGADASATIVSNASSFIGNGSGVGVDINGGMASVNTTRISNFATGISVSNGGQLTGAANNFIVGNTASGVTYAADASPTQGMVMNNDLSGNTSKAIINGLTGTTIAATCNWYGTTDPAASLFTGLVTYIPYLNTGTDNEAGTPGFQPVPGACTTALALTLTASPTMILTTGTTTLSATVSGGTSPYSYSFSGPGMITPGGNTASVSGIPAGVQTFTVLVTDATTPGSQTISGTVSVTVTAANTAPTVANAIPPQSATVGQAFSYVIPAGTFTDAETPNSLTLSVSGLPAGLSFTAPATISGTPSTTVGSPFTVSVTATDPGSLSVSTSFAITVSPAPAVGNIQITEFMYDGTPGEYVELTNVGTAPVDMTGWTFDDNGPTALASRFSLSGFGIVQPNESVVFTQATAAAFRTAWFLPASVKVLGGNTDNLGRNDEINIYNNNNVLVDRLTYDDQSAAGLFRTQNVSAWTPPSNLSATVYNTAWVASVVPDVQNSYSAVTGNVGNPGGYYSRLPRVRVVESAGTTRVTEGGATDSYTLQLTSPPTADVTVTITPGSQLTVGPAVLTFTPANFSTVQTVTVTAVDDADVEGDHYPTITQSAASSDIAYSGIVINPVSVTITDNDVAATAPPTIQVANTTTPYLSLPANGPGFVSGVASDETDPASTLGVNFTLTDADTDVNSLTVTASSSTANATLNLTGAGSTRNLKIIPAGVGYSTIRVSVTDGVSSVSYVVNYAASAASTATSRFHTGSSDASTAIGVGGGYMFVADDENQVIRLYNRTNSGLPATSFDYNTSLAVTNTDPEVDIESSVQVGSRIYWLGSHSNSANAGNPRPNRYRLFATDLTGSGATATLSYVGRYDGLRTDLLAWDANNTHGLGANYFGFAASAATGVIPEAAGGTGFNMEGLTVAPDGTTGYVAFRAPIVPTTARTKALIVPVTNFTSLVSGNPTTGPATFGAPIQLDLGGRGIREIKRSSGGDYLIVAGSPSGFGAAPNDFRLYTWTGIPTDAPVLRTADLSGLSSNVSSVESIVELPATLTNGSSIQVLADNGDAVFYNDGTIAKELPQNNFKKFRSDYVTIGAAVNTAPTVANAIPPQSATVGQAFSYVIPAGTFTDAETPNSLTLSVSGLPAGLNFTAPATISGTPSTTVGSPFTVSVTATDPGSLSVSTTFTITVQPAAVVATPLALTFTASPTMILTTGTTTLSATVSGGTTPYSYTFSGPGTITPNGNTATVSNLPAGVQTFTVRVADATSPTSQTISATVSVTVSAPAPMNTAPTVANAIPPQSATVGQAFSYVIPAGTFTDAETPNSLTLSVSGLPAGLSFTAPATISGTPSTTVGSPFTVSVTATDPGSLSVSTSFAITVSPAGTTPTPTGPFAITGVTTVSCTTISAGERSLTFNPQYAGVTGQPITFRVVNELAATTNAGPYTLRLFTDNPVIGLRATQAGTAGEASFSYNWLAACNGGTPPTNTAPTVANAIPPQSATVGQGFSYVIPAGTFTDAETPNNLVLSVSGLPAGLSFTAPATISGTPSTTVGSPFTVSVTATDPGNLSVSTSFAITVSPAGTTPTPTGPFAITGVTTVSCTTISAGERSLTFNPQYAGVTGQPITFRVVNELAATTNAGPYTLRLYTDNPVIGLRATQAGTAGEASFSYNWLAACNGGTPPANTAPTVANAIPPQSATVGQGFSYVIPAGTFTDAETPNNLVLSVSGLPAGLNFTAPATISGTPSTTVGSPFTVSVTATDPGSLSVSTSFAITVSPAGTTPTPTGPFAITGVTTVSCTTISAGERSLTFNPQYAGVTGQPITFRVVNELAATTNAGPYTLRLFTDNPVISLRAMQAGTAGEASFSYNWLVACTNGNPRLGAEPVAPLRVRVLGNPVGNVVEAEVTGAEGRSLNLTLTDEQGRTLNQQSVEQAATSERIRFNVSNQPAGVLLLRATTPTQTQTIRVLKAK